MTQTATPETEEFEFSLGAEGSEAEAKALGGKYGKALPFFSLDQDEGCLGRFLNDAFADPNYPDLVPYITITQHSMIPTRPAPDGYKGTWPPRMSAVCRHAKAFRNKFADCFICDHMKNPEKKSGGKYEPTPRTYCLIAMREEVVGDGTDALGGPSRKGKVVGIRDKVREVPKMVDGKVVEGEVDVVKDIRLINLGRKNFFAILEGFAGKYETLLDRDYYITRKYTGNDTMYQIAPADKIDMGGGKIYDLRDPEIRARYGEIPDLRKIVADKANDEYYVRFWDTRESNARAEDNNEEGGSPATPAATATDVDDEAKMAELRARIKNGSGGEPAAAAPAETPAAETPAAETPAESPAAEAPAGGMLAL